VSVGKLEEDIGKIYRLGTYFRTTSILRQREILNHLRVFNNENERLRVYFQEFPKLVPYYRQIRKHIRILKVGRFVKKVVGKEAMEIILICKRVWAEMNHWGDKHILLKELAKEASPEAIRRIETELENPDKTVQELAILLLGDIGARESIPLVEQKVKSKSKNVAQSAVISLGKLISDVDYFIRLLKSKKGVVRKTAAEVLFRATGDVRYHSLYFGRVNGSFFDPKQKGALGGIPRMRYNMGKFRRALGGGEEAKLFRNVKDQRTVTLLGGKYAGRILSKIISEKAFVAWKKAVDSIDVWIKMGFNYIPAEPILKYKKFRNNKYVVYTKVLGETLAIFLRHAPVEFYNTQLYAEMMRTRQRIQEGLAFARVRHNDNREDNYTVELVGESFRMYIIDFADAESW